MTDKPLLPDFLIIGAIKAATTWISWQLQQNPAVFLPDPEPHFFSREYDRGFAWYAHFFAEARAGQKIGEKTADYLANPDAASRIAQVVPKIPLVVQLRNPVDRAYSDYCMLYRRGTVTGPPEDYLNPATASFRRFLDNGMYASHLSRWFDLFERDQIKIFLFEDVRSQPVKLMQDVSLHIGVPALDAPANMDARVNDSNAQFLPLPIRKMLQPIKQFVDPFRGNRIFAAARSSLAKPIVYPPLSADLRARLEDHYAADIGRLSALLNRSLDHWLIPAKQAA
jgi:hypothetical protein